MRNDYTLSNKYSYPFDSIQVPFHTRVLIIPTLIHCDYCRILIIFVDERTFVKTVNTDRGQAVYAG